MSTRPDGKERIETDIIEYDRLSNSRRARNADYGSGKPRCASIWDQRLKIPDTLRRTGAEYASIVEELKSYGTGAIDYAKQRVDDSGKGDPEYRRLWLMQRKEAAEAALRKVEPLRARGREPMTALALVTFVLVLEWSISTTLKRVGWPVRGKGCKRAEAIALLEEALQAISETWNNRS